MQWLGKYELSLDEMLEHENRSHQSRDAAADLIREMMPDTGVVAAKDVIAEAKRRGIADYSLARARNKLGIKTYKTPEGWLWKGECQEEPVF